MKIEMTRSQALKIGLLRCKCGHPPNNHFEHDKHPCARCECKVYREVVSLPVNDTTLKHWFEKRST